MQKVLKKEELLPGDKTVFHPLNTEIFDYLQLYISDLSILKASLLQNPFDASDIPSDLSQDVKDVLTILNQLHRLEKSIPEQYEDLKPVIILYLINFKFAFDYQQYQPEAETLINQEKVRYAFSLLEKLDVTEIRSELEDRLFSFLEPDIHSYYSKLLKFTKAAYKEKEQEIKNHIAEVIINSGIKPEIKSRIKSIFSIHRKVTKKKILYSQVLDTIGLRILVDTKSDCYKVMSIILMNWSVVSNKIKDYIEIPKKNGYQSIHLTIMEGQQPVEIQIRTHDMDHYANYGLAAHHKYKSKAKH